MDGGNSKTGPGPTKSTYGLEKVSFRVMGGGEHAGRRRLNLDYY